MKAVAYLEQNNPVVFFQLGLLLYNQGLNEDAAVSFARAVELDRSYSNAKYFLGLILYKLDETELAIQQFKEIEILNPENQEVKNIINNLSSGRSPFSDGAVSVPVESLEDIKELPFNE